ncbi:gluconate 2-dehydrogenase subunit 3 family protein [Viridibacillus sp. NPDC093762]|uniref:gluconate 2-dehydrogenase subunit 3 family protein n=1 Tax=Viridibacillus sp. NPDC093762 TaxID=3390720 RepID=UPI003D063B35
MSQEGKDLSRRDFLKTTGIATGTLVGGGIIGGLIGYNTNKKSKPSKNANNTTGHNEHSGVPARMFFMSQTDFQVLSNATERIFPKDNLGAGAIDLGVPYFIDRQLAGNYGSNSKEYMQGPFAEGAPTQGYQSRLTRAEIFTQGVMALEKESKKRFKKGFSDITDKQMDEILTAFQKDEVKMSGTTSGLFFSLLRSATLNGAYADPMYGGNRNLEGWKMKGFPGHQMAYISEIEKDEFKKYEPKSLGSI